MRERVESILSALEESTMSTKHLARAGLAVGLLFVLTGAFHGCTKSVCNNDIGSLTLDPNGSTCTKRCDCNNQAYEGYCIDQRCISFRREECKSPKKYDTCVLQPHFYNAPGIPANCASWIRICQDEGIDGLNWGDCKCGRLASSEENGEQTRNEQTRNEQTSSEQTSNEQASSEQTSDAGPPEPTPDPKPRCQIRIQNFTCDTTEDACCTDRGHSCISGTGQHKYCTCDTDADCLEGAKCCSSAGFQQKVCRQEVDGQCPQSTAQEPQPTENVTPDARPQCSKTLSDPAGRCTDNNQCCLNLCATLTLKGGNTVRHCSCKAEGDCPAGLRCCRVPPEINAPSNVSAVCRDKCENAPLPEPTTNDAGAPEQPRETTTQQCQNHMGDPTQVQADNCNKQVSGHPVLCCTGSTCTPSPRGTVHHCSCTQDRDCPEGLQCCPGSGGQGLCINITKSQNGRCPQ